MGTATPTALACCLAVLMAYCVPPASGAWLWNLTVPKTNDSTVAHPASVTAAPAFNATIGFTNTTKAPHSATETPPQPRLRSGKSNKTGSRNGTKKQPQLGMSAQSSTTTSLTNSTDTPPSPAPTTTNQMEPHIFQTFHAEVPESPVQNPSPIVIVEPDSYGGSSYHPAAYSQPYSAMSLPPSPYEPLHPYSPAVPYSTLPFLPPLPQQMQSYGPYYMGGLPNYPPFGGYPLGGYQGPYSPYPYSGWRPHLPEPMPSEVREPIKIIRTVNDVGCSSEVKNDHEEHIVENNDKSVTQESEKPRPTYVSPSPIVPVKAPMQEVASQNPGKEVPTQEPLKQSLESENVVLRNNPYVTRDHVGNQIYTTMNKPNGMNNNGNSENHILRNNPFQQSMSFWPAYYSQPQWPDWSPWQQWSQWTGTVQQMQYPYSFSTVPSARRYPYERQVEDPRSTGRHYA